jgi:ATP dependent DNA ligase domain
MTDPDPTDPDPTIPDPDPISLAIPLRPQAYGRERADRIGQPVVEPHWLGMRVIVAVVGDRVVIYDDGEPVGGQERIASRLIRMLAHTAQGVIMDGYLTRQVSADDLPAAFDSDVIPTPSQLVTKVFVGYRRDRHGEKVKRIQAEEAARTFTEGELLNLVVTDLLWLDGEWLLDVPLLERKRLLEAVIPGDDLVRAGPYVQPPYGTWMGSWRSQGFTGLTFKEANSRYRPGEESSEWTTSELPRR